jgi:hypothetical protein
MYMVGDKDKRDFVEAAIREAHKQRAVYFAQLVRSGVAKIKKGIVALKSKLRASNTPTGFGHTGHTA